MKTLISLACLLAAGPVVRAGDANAAAAKAAPSVITKQTAGEADAAGVYVPKTKSFFNGTDNDHNPFWPIGWVKSEEASGDDAANALVPHAEDFTVTTILLNDPPMAVINGKDMAEGEVASLSVNGQAVVVQLMAVQDGRVILRWQNQNIIVPIHRQEELSAADTTAQQ
jgi:hypothetical protein